jgi:omega-amidase
MAAGAAAGGGPVVRKTFQLALCQTLVGRDKAANIAAAIGAVRGAKRAGADLVVLGEIWNGPYATSEFPKYAEPVPRPGGDVDAAVSPSLAALRDVAAEEKVWLVGGTVSEVGEGGKYFNTCTVWSPEGRLVGVYRKMHLFDIDIPGKQTFRESDVLTAGDSLCVVDLPWGKAGIGICYDMRFPQLAAIYAQKGCTLLIYPGAFNVTTGPKHWELLQRARAVDYQLWVATASPARNPESTYQAWGHSSVVDPWGAVVATTEHDPATVLCAVDLDVADQVRAMIPVRRQPRTDLYSLPAWTASPDGRGEEEEEGRA